MSSDYPWLDSRYPLRKVSHCFEVRTGKMLQRERAALDEQLVPYLKAMHVQDDVLRGLNDLPEMWISPAEVQAIGVRVGDLLICEGGQVGRAALVTPEVPTNTAIEKSLHRVRGYADNSLRYLHYVLGILRHNGWFEAAGGAATLTHLTRETLCGLRIPVPAVRMQRAVARYLDREIARIDALIAAKQQLVELVRERFNVSRIDLVVDRPRQERRDGPHWLGSIPTTWKLKRLKFVADMESGHTPNKQIDAYWINCTIPWVTLNDVGDLQANWRFYEPANAVNELGLQNSSAHILPEGAVVLSRDATVGRSALLGRPMAVSQHFVAWVCGPELIPEYLLNVFRGPMQHLFGSLTAGATIPTIGMPDLNQLVVPIPPIEQQERIVKRLAAVEGHATGTLDVINRQIALIQEHRQALIAAAVTGQLDVPDAA